MQIAEDSDSQKRWNVTIDGQKAGGVYATSLGGQVTGFRAGHMAPGFQGALIIDDPIKPEHAFSRVELDKANRALLTTVKSRKANPDTPIIIIMQRIAESDPVGFIKGGSLGTDWTFVKIPALIDEEYYQALDDKYKKMIEPSEKDESGRFSYWPYKEPLKELLAMERGDGADQNGARISRHVYTSQYQQEPVALGGNIIRGEHFERYAILPTIKHRKIYADTAQKTKEANDFSVFEEWGYGEDGKAYLIDMIRGKWEAPELQKRAVAFWNKCKGRDINEFGQLRKMLVEDKSSGTGLIQTLKLPPYNITIEPIERTNDKLTRVMDALPYIEAHQICVPEDAPFTNDFISECEAFTADDSHDFDDQVDPLCDMVVDMLSSGNKIKRWESLAKST
jgi:predicted phage terminase large subunit-like protein